MATTMSTTTRTKVRAVRLSAVALLFAALGCGEPTQLILEVESDVILSAVAITVTRDGGEARTRSYSQPTPFSVTLVPDGPTSASRLIVATGQTSSREMTRAAVRTSFIEGKRLVVRLRLSERCLNVECAREETCVEGSCIGATIDPSTLPEYGQRDAGRDTGRDTERDADMGDADADATMDTMADTREVDAPDGGECAPGTVDRNGDPADGCECRVSAELCDGRDNDCDPETADGSDEPTLGNACDGRDDLDLCADGIVRCQGGSLRCDDDDEFAAELCDGADNDCDPRTLDGTGDERIGVACDTGCRTICVDGEVLCPDDDAQEICNGIDDDCDGSIDEGFDIGAPCGECGIVECANERATRCSTGDTGSGATPPEICNGIDDDCDGQVDGPLLCRDCQWSIVGDGVYLFCPMDMTHESATAECRGFGYQLAELDDMDENVAVNAAARDEGFRQFWLGLRRSPSEPDFRRRSGSGERLDDAFAPWGPAHPAPGDRHCVYSESRLSQWFNDDCDEEYSFVCEL